MFDPIPVVARQRRAAAPQAWLGRAAQARRIAAMLSRADASILEAYALECEAQAAALLDPPAPPIAA